MNNIEERKDQDDRDEDKTIRELNHKLTIHWCYLQSEELWEETEEYLEEHDDDEFPFEANWIN